MKKNKGLVIEGKTFTAQNSLQKKVYLFPGCAQDSGKYNTLINLLTTKGYRVVAVKIDWKSNSFSKYFEEVLSQVTDAAEKDLFLGFSYGSSLIEYLRPELKLKRICCSTPDILDKTKRKVFDEITSPSGVTLDWKEVDDFIKNNPKASVELFVSGSEEEMYVEFAKTLSQRYDAKYTIIPGAKHNINSTAYVNGLEQIL